MTLRERARRAGAAVAAGLVCRPALLTLAFASLYTATYDSDMGSPDEHQRYRLALDVARRGLGALKDSAGVSKYPPLQSILGGELMRLGLLFDHGQEGVWTARLGLSVSLLACIALVPLFYWVARLLEVPARRAAVATALFAITNPIWPYSKRFFSEPLTAFLALGAFAGALAWVRRGDRVALGFGLACLFFLPLNNMIIPVAVWLGLAALFLLQRRWRSLTALAAVGVASAALFAVTIWLRFGALRTSGYGNERFTFGVFDGLHGLLFGWGRSVFVYAPLLVLSVLGLPALRRRCSGAAAAVLVSFAVTLLLIASWWCWWGGICWGPRLVLPILPIASLGAPLFLSEPRRWRALVAVPVVLAGLYVQLMGVAFKHDFDIYFWMNGAFEQERKAWFEWQYSSVRRMPRHFREHPWDLSSSFLTLEQRGPSVVEIGRRPVRQVEIVNRGDALMMNWSIADLFAVLDTGDGTRRVPARELGARLVTFNGQDGSGALDGDPRTRWSTGTKRLDGNWVRLELERTRSDLVRLELEHLPFDRDFPNGLEARIRADSGEWASIPAHAATPRLVWNPLIFLLAATGALLALASVRRGSEPEPGAGSVGEWALERPQGS